MAWTGLRFEINFSESAILGMIGAGGIGFAIANNIQGYQFGAAGLAIVLVFVFACAWSWFLQQQEKLYLTDKG